MCVPTAKEEIVSTARPVASSERVPNGVVPSMKVTLDVGTPLPGELAVTTAVKVTAWPKTAVGADEVIWVAVPSLFTISGDAESLPLLFPQPFVPVKLAVMVCVPTARAEVLNEA